MRKRFGWVCLVIVFSGYSAYGWQMEKIYASGAQSNDMFGSDVAISGDYAVIGANKNNPGAPDPLGEAYFFHYENGAWVEQANVHASDGVSNDMFGISVAIDGDYAIVGATRQMLAGGGSAHIFVRSGTNWTEQQKLTKGVMDGSYGEDVDISGERAIVGSRLAGTGGEAYIYKRTGSSWTLEDTLVGSDTVVSDWFGYWVAIDGDYAIVGDSGKDSYDGRVYIFRRNGTSWDEEALLTSPVAPGQAFGDVVDIDGDYAIAGNWVREQGVHVYMRSGTNWVLQEELGDIYDPYRFGAQFYGDDAVISDPYMFAGGGDSAILWKRDETNWVKQIHVGNSNWDVVGTRVGLGGGHLIVGLPFNDDVIDNAGAIVAIPVDDRNRQSEMWSDDLLNSGNLGSGVAVDGEFALVGAPAARLESNEFGYASVFVRSNEYWDTYTQLLPEEENRTNSIEFGESAALWGNYALVGAPDDDEAAEKAGAVYVYHYDTNGVWGLQEKIVPPAASTNAEFGRYIETDGDCAIIASYLDIGWDGLAYVYTRTDTNWSYDRTFYGVGGASDNHARAIGFDGQYVIMGSAEGDGGAAYIHRQQGSNWVYEGRIVSSSSNAFAFGDDVDVSGNYAIVGDAYESPDLSNQGAAYIFKRAAESNWVEHVRLEAPEPATNGWFGAAVDIEGNVAVVIESGTDSMYAYRRFDDRWLLRAILSGGDINDDETFARRVDMSDKYALAGMAAQSSRKAYMFYVGEFAGEPIITDISLNTNVVTLDLDKLYPTDTVTVQRCHGLILPSWASISSFVATTTFTNWDEAYNEDWTNTFYRLAIEPQ